MVTTYASVSHAHSVLQLQWFGSCDGNKNVFPTSSTAALGFLRGLDKDNGRSLEVSKSAANSPGCGAVRGDRSATATGRGGEPEPAAGGPLGYASFHFPPKPAKRRIGSRERWSVAVEWRRAKKGETRTQAVTLFSSLLGIREVGIVNLNNRRVLRLLAEGVTVSEDVHEMKEGRGGRKRRKNLRLLQRVAEPGGAPPIGLTALWGGGSITQLGRGRVDRWASKIGVTLPPALLAAGRARISRGLGEGSEGGANRLIAMLQKPLISHHYLGHLLGGQEDGSCSTGKLEVGTGEGGEVGTSVDEASTLSGKCTPTGLGSPVTEGQHGADGGIGNALPANRRSQDERDERERGNGWPVGSGSWYENQQHTEPVGRSGSGSRTAPGLPNEAKTCVAQGIKTKDFDAYS
ncbi:hypothetical protein BDN72DRAFT_859050 [Pluteus cervinus]|uniref:Uncharacterized protein n=1 Tax=Pluteus cervinus TaxID=181527 RepID=A0ACD3AP28_9AGAR|nr:hypothetical protein BDN72DRAFT_859050 [Pluteus cervinus]